MFPTIAVRVYFLVWQPCGRTENGITGVVSKGSNLVEDQYGLWRLARRARTSELDTNFIQTDSDAQVRAFSKGCLSIT